ncbi:hypothetical protein [Pseudomonas gorinensis]
MKAPLLILSIMALLSGCASTPAPDLSRPSIAETKSVVFAGKTFVLKFQKNGGGRKN